MQPGDHVQISSGGPKMTVDIVSNDGIECAWFEGGKTRFRTFNPASLVPYGDARDPEKLVINIVRQGGVDN